MLSETSHHLADLQEQGFALLPAVLDSQQVIAVRAAIDRLQPFHWDYRGLVDDHYKCVFNRDPFWLPYLDLPGVIELAEAALGADCHVIGQTAWRSHPGFVGAELHVDYLIMELPENLLTRTSFVLPMQICTAMLYLDDIDLDLCPTWVIPGSHKSGRKPRMGEDSWQGCSAEPVLCRAGDVLMLRSELWHAGSRNRTRDRSRYLLQVHYGRRMVAQKFSPYLRFFFNPAVLAAATPRQRRLLGDHEAADNGAGALRAWSWSNRQFPTSGAAQWPSSRFPPVYWPACCCSAHWRAVPQWHPAMPSISIWPDLSHCPVRGWRRVST